MEHSTSFIHISKNERFRLVPRRFVVRLFESLQSIKKLLVAGLVPSGRVRPAFQGVRGPGGCLHAPPACSASGARRGGNPFEPPAHEPAGTCAARTGGGAKADEADEADRAGLRVEVSAVNPGGSQRRVASSDITRRQNGFRTRPARARHFSTPGRFPLPDGRKSECGMRIKRLYSLRSIL